MTARTKAGKSRKKGEVRAGKSGGKSGPALGASKRAQKGDNHPPEDPGPPPRPTPTPPPQIIGVVFRTFICLDPQTRAQVIAGLQAQLRNSLRLNTLDVISACVANTEILRVRLFPRPGTPSAPDPDFIKPTAGELFTSFISKEFIQNRASAIWAAQPRRLNDKGKPDPKGDVTLKSFSVNLVGPNRVVAVVKGVYDTFVSTEKFQLTLTDTLRASNGRVTADVKLEVDVSGLFGGLIKAIFGANGTAFASMLLPDEARDRIPSLGGIIARLLPPEVIVGGGDKLVFQYNNIEVKSSGIFISGAAQLEDRVPRVSIAGRKSLEVELGDPSVRSNYSAVTTDMRAPLVFQWTVQGGVAAQPSRVGTAITFDTKGMKLKDKRIGRARVRVVDVDGLDAEAKTNVSIKIAVEPPTKKPKKVQD